MGKKHKPYFNLNRRSRGGKMRVNHIVTEEEREKKMFFYEIGVVRLRMRTIVQRLNCNTAGIVFYNHSVHWYRQMVLNV